MIRPGRKHALVLLFAVVAGVGVATAASRLDAGRRADLVYYDLWHRLAGERFRPAHVALAIIDEPTLAEQRDTPLVFWTPLFARAAARLREAGATAIGFDFIFSASAESWLSSLPLADKSVAEQYGLPFRQEIARGATILAASRLGLQDGADEFLLPAPEYLLAIPGLDVAGHVALADLVADDDGGTRRFEAAPKLVLPKDVKPSEAPRLSLAALLAKRAGAKDLPEDDARRLITYAGPPGTVPSVSLRTLLADDALSRPEVRALRGKAVLVGANYPGMNDVHFTPYASGLLGRSGSFMAGAEIQASIAESLLSGRHTEPVPAWAAIAIAATLAAGAALAFAALSPWAGFAALALAALLAAMAGYALFAAFLVLPVASIQLGLAAAYGVSYGARLTREERERTRIGQMFGRYVSPQVVAHLVASPALPELGGRAQPVTVLFSDIRGFTTLSEKLSAPEVVEMLNTYFERACAAMLAEGGSIDKFIGDAIMVEFGAPLEQADHARRAIRAALALRRTALEFRPWMAARFPDRGLHEFDVGIGLHSGEAVVGNIGSSLRMEYTAIGDTVNLASRLEGATKEVGCAILASDATVQAAGPGVRTGKTDRIHVKGREQAVVVHEILDIETPENPA